MTVDHFASLKQRPMKKIIIVFGVMATAIVCKSAPRPKAPDGKAIFHKITVQEVVQTTSYTYLHVKEVDSLEWLAVPLMQAKAGETYYYTGGLSMKKFESKELHRTFDEVLFLGGVSSAPGPNENPSATTDIAAHKTASPGYTRKAAAEVKKQLTITAAKDGISIADLFAKKEALAGKKVIIKGEVTKYSPSIMDKNWIHLQDGTEFNGKFDLTITSEAAVKIGDIVTLEGKVTLNKDFGYGYFFEVMLEEAIVK